MTAPTMLDPALILRQFRNGLSLRARNQLREIQRVPALLHRAVFTQGWTLEELLEQCSRDWRGVDNVGSLIAFRLEWCADNPPPAPAQMPRTHSGCCDNGWIYDESGKTPAVTKCPGVIR